MNTLRITPWLIIGIFSLSAFGVSFPKRDEIPKRGNEIISIATTGTELLAVTHNGDLYCANETNLKWELCHQAKIDADRYSYNSWGALFTSGNKILYRVTGTYNQEAIWESINMGKTWREIKSRKSNINGAVDENGNLYFKYTNKNSPLGIYLHKPGSAQEPSLLPGTEFVKDLCAIAIKKDILYFGSEIPTNSSIGIRLFKSNEVLEKDNSQSSSCQLFLLDVSKEKAKTKFLAEYTGGGYSSPENGTFIMGGHILIRAAAPQEIGGFRFGLHLPIEGEGIVGKPTAVSPGEKTITLTEENQDWFLSSASEHSSIWLNNSKGIFKCDKIAKSCQRLSIPSQQYRSTYYGPILSKRGNIYIIKNGDSVLKWVENEQKWKKILDNKILNVYPQFLPNKAR